jgi:peptidoglycan/LPS O-acetylase OafA/YrhL
VNTSAERCVFLDGLRGWAALAVLLYHLFIDDFYVGPEFVERLLLFNGIAAVYLFFVVSGFSLSIGYIRRHDGGSLARTAVSRYPRLAIPVLAACAFTFVLMISGAIPAPSERPSGMQEFLPLAPSIDHLLRTSLFDTFFHYSASTTYIPPLWTMRHELAGSALIFGLLAVCGRSAWRMWCYVAAIPLAAVAWHPIYAAFIAGLIIAEYYNRRGVVSAAVQWIAAVLFASSWLLLAFNGTMHEPLILAIGMVALCVGVAWNGPLRRFFENRFARFLGWISFPLYLTHSTIEFSLSARLDTTLATLGWAPKAAHLVVGLATIPVALAVAVLFAPLNDIAVKLSHGFGALVVAATRKLLLAADDWWGAIRVSR